MSGSARRAARERRHGAGPQLGNAAKDRPGRRHVAQAQVFRDRTRLDTGVEARDRTHCVQLGGEDQIAVDHAPVQRLLAEPVSAEMQLLSLTIPEREGEHPGDAAQGVPDAPAREALDEDLGVGMATPFRRLSGDIDLTANVAVVVDLAVVQEDEAAVVRGHRLRAIRAHVDDRQPQVAETQTLAFVYPLARTVGPPMGDRAGHAACDAEQLVTRARGAPAPDSRYSAHDELSAPARGPRSRRSR
jgi:hypothetical protein